MVTKPEPLAQHDIKRLRTAGLLLPRAPRPGERWVPRTDAEAHLLREAQRLDHVRQLLLAEVGRLRRASGERSGAEIREEAAREAARLRECPLSPSLLGVVAAGAAGLTQDETATRLHFASASVKTSRARVAAILGTRSFGHSIAVCVQAGWVAPGPTRTGVEG